MNSDEDPPNLDNLPVSEGPTDSIDVDQFKPILIDHMNSDEDPPNLDNLPVGEDPTDSNDQDQLTGDDGSAQNPNDDPSNLSCSSNPTLGKDPKHKIEKVNASGMKRKRGRVHRELGKLQDSLSKNEKVTKGKRRCAK